MATDTSSNAGFLPLSREAFRNPFWKERRRFSRWEAFADLCQMAAIEPTVRQVDGIAYELAPGELVASMRFLASRWQWPTTTVHRFIAKLSKDQWITKVEHQAEHQAEHLRLSESMIYPHDRNTKRNTNRNEFNNVDRQRNGKAPKVSWNPETGWGDLPDKLRSEYESACPLVDIAKELQRAHGWLRDNPARRPKSNYQAFLTRWLNRAQADSEERGVVAPAASNEPTAEEIAAWWATVPEDRRLCEYVPSTFLEIPARQRDDFDRWRAGQ